MDYELLVIIGNPNNALLQTVTYAQPSSHLVINFYHTELPVKSNSKLTKQSRIMHTFVLSKYPAIVLHCTIFNSFINT